MHESANSMKSTQNMKNSNNESQIEYPHNLDEKNGISQLSFLSLDKTLNPITKFTLNLTTCNVK